LFLADLLVTESWVFPNGAGGFTLIGNKEWTWTLKKISWP